MIHCGPLSLLLLLVVNYYAATVPVRRRSYDQSLVVLAIESLITIGDEHLLVLLVVQMLRVRDVKSGRMVRNVLLASYRHNLSTCCPQKDGATCLSCAARACCDALKLHWMLACDEPLHL